ncbi:MAG: DUF4352 domain-containing protein [Actinomycetota bacterium]|nr:DUF4352 domain-containing protein [Actinomycetota bacterium]
MVTAVVRSLGSALGILAFVTAIVVGSLAATGIISDAAQSFRVGGSERNIVPATRQFEPKIDFIGETTTAGELTWTIETARQTTEVKGFALPPAPLRGNLVVVDFTVENVSDGPVTLTPESLVLVDEAGRESPPAASDNTEYVVPEYAILFNERALLDPGEEKEGKVIYNLEVPFEVNPEADLSGFRLRLGDGDPTIIEEEHVDLEF